MRKNFSRGSKPQRKKINRKNTNQSERSRPGDKTFKSTAKLNEPIRLNKAIAESGLCSRRKADELIEEGKVKVNGKNIKELGTKVERNDFITVNGDPIPENVNTVYVLLNKPKDVITTTDDEKDRKTVVDLIKTQERIFPIGRLDRNTTGILLLSNDGELAHRLTHPSYTIVRVYNVLLDKKLNGDHAEKMSAGVELEDGKTGPAEILIHPGKANKITISLTEGKNREVRRLFEHFGYEVKQLDRKEFAGLNYRGVERGQYRHLNRKELIYLKKLVKLG